MADPQDPRGPSRGSVGWLAAFVGAVVVVVVVVVVARTRGTSTAGEAAARAPNETAIQIVSEPAGATVVREDDGGVLGVTPLDVVLPMSDKELPVLVRLPGYQQKRVTVPLYSQSGRIDVGLTAVGADPPAPPKPPPDGWEP